MNCVVQDGILKAAFYLPEHLRLDGNNPAYEVFLDKKAHQFLTYDHLEKKWRDAKLDRLNWPGRNYYATCWASEKDAAVEGDEWLFSLEVPVSIQSDHLPIRDDLDDNILSDAAIILIIIRGRSVPCAINCITVAVVIR